ncbi:MAG: M28 family peptidase, partial [Bacteroidetes bacterium]|nr:M28 family peptidase [Bacteroidota bacterium]
MTRSLYLILFSGLLILASCESSKTVDQAAEMITEESLMTHIETLSSDRFQGRAPATEGEELTVDYLIDQFEQIGVEPGMPDGSFVQEFPLLGQQVDGSAAMLSLKQNGSPIGDFSYTDDFMAWPSNQEQSVDLSDAELLYVGYGIQAPEFDWDDYKDRDVSGKVLVFKNSDPAYDEELFGGDARLYYGRWSYKFEKAAEMGALGAIIVHTTPTAGYPWAVVSNSWGRERFYLVSEGDNESMPAFNGWLTEETSASLFEAAGFDLSEMLDAADDPDFEPIPLNGITLDISLEAEYSNQTAKNVIGKIEGSDPDLMDEYVVFTAHHDHLGITTPVDGDSINNGATDNAAGMSAVLNLANAYKATQDSMRRSALFLFVGAEEVGLLGSKYWAEHPTVHPGKVTANFNMDGMQV